MSNQKGTALLGAALTDETLASSDSVLKKGQFGGHKGLQQFYSPPELAKLVRHVVGSRVAVLDPTAGDGSLLKEFDPPFSFGVEIDKDQIKNAEGGYNAIQGDVQHVFNLLRLAAPSWDAVVLNPPFGLTWEDPSVRKGKPTNSAVTSFLYGIRLLDEHGQLVFVCGKNRFYRQIADLPEASGIYAVIECDDLFDGTAEPCAVAFALHPSNRSETSSGYETRPVPRDMLDMAATWVTGERTKALGPYGHLSTASYGAYSLPEVFKAIQAEYDRRTEKRLKTNREFDALLVNRDTVQWLPSAFASKALQQAGEAYSLHGLNGQNINYFLTNERVWNKIMQLREQAVITVEPKLVDAVEALLADLRKEVCPLYEIKPQQRLGYLTDIDYLRCTVSDPERGFVEGDSYRLDTKTKTVIETEERVVESKKNPGEYEVKKFEKQRKLLDVTVGNWRFYDSGEDASENIQYLIDHFELPDPGEIESRHPEEIAALEKLAREVLKDFEANSRVWEEQNPQATPFRVRDFQVQDVARLAFKGSGLLSWEQGLGKTMGGLLFTEMMVRLGAQDVRLVVTAGDLVDQWTREAERFLGKKPTLIKTHEQAHRLAKQLRRKRATGFYITYYEVLSIVGTKGRNKALPPITVEEKIETKLKRGTDRWGYFVYADDSDETGLINEDGSHREQVPVKNYYSVEDHTRKADGSKKRVHHGYIHPQWEEVTKKITSKEVCPECRADTRNGWNGLFCEAELDDGSRCGYAHYAVKLRPIGSYLSSAFKHGCIIIDELTKIQGDESKVSKVLRGLNARHRLGLTGTPIKNFIGQAFWLLWWCLGNGSPRFGYTYDGGHTKFENDFSVVEYVRNGNKRENRKALPEVTNLSVLWRLLASSIIRRRKEETGERLVPKFYHEISVPLGMAQTELIAKWLKDFPKLFAEKYPDHKVVAAGMHEIMAPLLGLNAKLDYALTLPLADPDIEWPGIEGVSNYTPATLRTLELAMALVKEGRKVLIGSNVVATSKWLADTLTEKGVDAVHILDESGSTTNPKNRAKRVHLFQTDEAQVFCAGVKAIRLGHNLDAANAVILHGLDWDYETLDQFVARVHRLTSTRPIDVYVVLPSLEGQQTLTTRKWHILTQKGQAAGLALDGRLIERQEDHIDKAQIIRELMERGLTVTNEAVDELSVEEAWEAIPPIDEYEPPEGLLPPTPPWEPTYTPEECLELAQLHADLFPKTIPALPVNATVTITPEVEAAIEDGRRAEAEMDAVETPATSATDPVPDEVKTPEAIPDELVLAQNAAEMPAEPEGVATDPNITALMEQMAAMQQQMADLQAKNEALEQRLAEPEQLSLIAEEVV